MAHDPRPRPSRRRRGADLLHESDRIATTASVELEERVGGRGAIAAQFRENQPGGRVTLPDEPVSLVSSSRTPAQIAREADGRWPMV
jgi:hypothetical protein